MGRHEILVTDRRGVALGDLLGLVVVSHVKKRPVDFVHLLKSVHHILVDTIQYILHTPGQGNSR